MKYLGILTSARTAPEFVGAEPVQRATWLCLMLFCAEHETGGVVEGCKQWCDRRWMQTCGVTKAEVMVESTLFHFLGNDLTVWGYQVDYEAGILARREAGRKGGLRSVAVRLKRRNEAQVEAVLERPFERKDRIGGIGYDGGGGHAHAGEVVTLSGMKASPPTLDEVLIHAGVVGMTDAQAREFFDFWTGAEWTRMNGVPLRNWKAAMVSRKNDLANGGTNHGRTNNRRRVADNHWSSGSGEYDGIF